MNSEASPVSLSDYELLANDCFNQFINWKRNKSGWTVVKHSVPGVDMWEYKVEGFDIPLILTEGVLDASPQDAFEFQEFGTLQDRKRYDKLIALNEIVEEISEDLSVVYCQYNGFYPVSARDFCAFKVHKKLPNGAYAVYGHTINHPKKPPNTSFVRARGKSAAFFDPIPDPRGSIPYWIINMAKNQNASSIVKMNEAIVQKYGTSRISTPLLDGYESESEQYYDFEDDVDTSPTKPSDFSVTIAQVREITEILDRRLQQVELKVMNSGVFLSWKAFSLLLGWPVLIILVYHMFVRKSVRLNL
eukprot:TRINITY_DN856_c0_g1_i5.p1 TRINITY_DN856_c0_g1~~TRINITY_DN856_c0_g1_i5.p1  ORF type:complete len:303 (-),score=28.62 TRINITY_DN856_c0_g1_i5:50-958(-)